MDAQIWQMESRYKPPEWDYSKSSTSAWPQKQPTGQNYQRVNILTLRGSLHCPLVTDNAAPNFYSLTITFMHADTNFSFAVLSAFVRACVFTMPPPPQHTQLHPQGCCSKMSLCSWVEIHSSVAWKSGFLPCSSHYRFLPH